MDVGRNNSCKIISAQGEALGKLFSKDSTPSDGKTYIPDDADRFVSERDGSAGRPAYDVLPTDGSLEKTVSREPIESKEDSKKIPKQVRNDNLFLNQEPPRVMHIDLNSCFATVEQQSRPSLRGKPIGVTNRVRENCCVIAASIEAKQLGVKVGMSRKEAEQLVPNFIMLETDPPKYHWAYQRLMRIMKSYSPNVKMKSIDEGLIDFHGTPHQDLVKIGYEIKQRLHEDLGCWMRCNIGIGTNRFLAKLASNLHKPDGLDVINSENLAEIYDQLKLTDLPGIAKHLSLRLMQNHINTPLEFLMADDQVLRKQVFRSNIIGLSWYQRLRGFEVDDFKTKQGQVGRQFVLDKRTNDDDEILSRLQYLCQTSAMKLRHSGLDARGMLIWLAFAKAPTFGNGRPEGFWQKRKMYDTAVFTDHDVFARARELFLERPRQTVTAIGMTCYGLTPTTRSQITLLPENVRADDLMLALDDANTRYGNFTVTYADALIGKNLIKQKIPFGSTRYFELLISGA